MAKAVPQTIAEEIVKLVGGKENIKTVASCSTRLRMTLHDDSKADKAAIKAINGVMGLVEQNEQLQIILGPGMVTKVTNIVGQLTSLKIGQVDEVAERKAELNDVYWSIDQIIYGYERKDREMLIKGVSELLQTQAEMFIF